MLRALLSFPVTQQGRIATYVRADSAKKPSLVRFLLAPQAASFLFFKEAESKATGFHVFTSRVAFTRPAALTFTSGMFFKADRLAGGGPRSLRSCSCSLRPCARREKKNRRTKQYNTIQYKRTNSKTRLRRKRQITKEERIGVDRPGPGIPHVLFPGVPDIVANTNRIDDVGFYPDVDDRGTLRSPSLPLRSAN